MPRILKSEGVHIVIGNGRRVYYRSLDWQRIITVYRCIVFSAGDGHYPGITVILHRHHTLPEVTPHA